MEKQVAVVLVFRNADFTEGRGPKMFDKAFHLVEDAQQYVRQQNGIMGTPQIRGIDYSDGTQSWNGYTIRIVPVMSKEMSMRAEMLKEKIDSLEQQIANHRDELQRLEG